MQFKRPLPLFFLILFVVSIFVIPISPVHAVVPTLVTTAQNSSLCDGGGTPCTVTISGVTAGDFILTHTFSMVGSNPVSVTDTFSDTWTNLIATGRETIWNTKALSTGSVTITLNFNPSGSCSFAGSPGCVFSVEDFTGVGQIGNTNFDNPGCTGACSDTLSLNVKVSQAIVYEGFAVYGGGLGSCPTLTPGSSQTITENLLCLNGLAGAFSKGITVYTAGRLVGTQNFVMQTSASTQTTHMLVELDPPIASPNNVVTQCYGECGTPAITLTNSNATHPVNFNQSFTLFYEFQSSLSGTLQNVTINVAKSYTNGQQVALGAYTATCPPGTTPFTINCAGSLQPGFAISNPNVAKGRFSINVQTPVVSGQWIAIAFTAIYSGMDLNQTNGTCGDVTSGICAGPPGMSFSKGTIPQTLSQTSSCSTAVNSPCNFGSISSTGLWAWISGNVVINTPLPPPSTGCINSDLSCFMIASACALTPSNCFIGGAVYLFIYFTIFVAGISICISWVNSSYEVELHFPPAIFFLFFLVELFMFTAMGLIPQYVTVVIFIFTALGVAGYFGSAFMGRGGSSD